MRRSLWAASQGVVHSEDDESDIDLSIVGAAAGTTRCHGSRSKRDLDHREQLIDRDIARSIAIPETSFPETMILKTPVTETFIT